MTKELALYNDFSKSVQRLREALAKPKDVFMRDSATQRFEMTFDLAWKSVKNWLKETKAVECFSPKTCFQEAFQNGLGELVDSKLWATMVNNRNLIAHTYDEKTADEVYAALPEYLKLFEKLLGQLKGK